MPERSKYLSRFYEKKNEMFQKRMSFYQKKPFTYAQSIGIRHS